MKVSELFEAEAAPGNRKVFVIFDKASDKYVSLEMAWGGRNVPMTLSDHDPFSQDRSESYPAWNLKDKIPGWGMFQTKQVAQKYLKKIISFRKLDVASLKPHEDMLSKGREEYKEAPKGTLGPELKSSWNRLVNKYKKLIAASKSLDLEVREVEVPFKHVSKYSLLKN